MHQLLHVVILASTLLGAGALALFLAWPLLFDSAAPPRMKAALVAAAGAGAGALLLEWRVVH